MERFALIAEIALIVINKDNYEVQMNKVLKMIGEYFQVSRTYIFIDNDENTVTRNMFEWCDKGILSQIDNLQEVKYESIPSWINLLLTDGNVCAADINELPNDIVAILEPQGVRSVIAYPILIGQKMKGFIGFDECKSPRTWNETTQKLLEIISLIIGSAYEKNTFLNVLRIGEHDLIILLRAHDLEHGSGISKLVKSYLMRDGQRLLVIA